MRRNRAGIGCLIAAALMMVISGWGWSQAASAPAPGLTNTTVATVNVFKVFNECQLTTDVNELLQTRRAEIKVESKKRQGAIDLQVKALEPFSPGTPAYEKRNRELLKMRIDFEAWMRLTNAALGKGYMDWTKQTYKYITDAAEAVAKQRKVDVVLFNEQQPVDAPDAQKLREMILQRKVIYTSPRVDLTEDVMAAVNQAYRAAGGKQAISLGI